MPYRKSCQRDASTPIQAISRYPARIESKLSARSRDPGLNFFPMHEKGRLSERWGTSRYAKPYKLI